MDEKGNLLTISLMVDGMIDGVDILNVDQVLTTENANEKGHGSISCKVRC